MDHQENTNIFDSQQFDIQLVPIDSQILDWNPNKQKQHGKLQEKSQKHIEVHKQEQSYNDQIPRFKALNIQDKNESQCIGQKDNGNQAFSTNGREILQGIDLNAENPKATPRLIHCTTKNPNFNRQNTVLTENLFGGQLSQNLQQLQPFNQQNHNNFFCNKNTQQANEFNFFLQGVQSK